MYLRKAQAGSAPGHTWEADGDVLEVDDNLADQLLRIPGGGFTVGAPPEEEAEPPHGPDEPEEEEETDTPKKKGGRPPLPRDAEGNIIRN